ncbi:DUF1343 domain-containing protein [Acidobacteria bacterium AH-259-D05]|nr:DUF1343 domain-containing protein [Acidobacteria bacterium AH-259-D05]
MTNLKPVLAIVLAIFGFQITGSEAAVRVGADRILEKPYLDWIRGKRVGLITNPSGVNSQLETTMDLLAHHPEVELVALFGPEHGVLAQTQAGERVSSYRSVYSLYGETRAPTAQMLKDVEVLIYDIQDVGVRFYTYISTMFLSMQAAAENEIPFIVLDRPNPIYGLRVEGPVLQTGYESFVGIPGIPIRYGMTVGELAGLLNRQKDLGCDLKVVPLSGWNRRQWYDQTGLTWILPSPNMPTVSTAIVYPGFGLIEGTNLSEGRGTTLPFELVGAPWLNSQELAGRLNRLQLGGVRFRPQAFTPTFSKYQGQLCQGIQIHVLDRNAFHPLRVVLHLLEEVRKLHPGQLAFDKTFFDHLVGNSWVLQALTEGRPAEEIMDQWQPVLEEFKQDRDKYLLYP